MNRIQPFATRSLLALFLATSAATPIACKLKKEEKPTATAAARPTAAPTAEPAAEPTSGPEAATPIDGFSVSGTLSLNLNLDGSPHITHVVALNPETGRSFAVVVDPTTGKFTLPLMPGRVKSQYEKADGTIDREALKRDDPEHASEIDGMSDDELREALSKDSGGDSGENGTTGEPTPWVLTYVDATKTGKEMIVSRFAAQSLDSLAPVVGSEGSLDLGTVTPGNDGKAASETSYDDILSAISMSSSTATTFGSMDDICLRYVNPDIDNDGVLDMPIVAADGTTSGGQKKFILDFHNRFNWKKADNQDIQWTELRGKFPDEVAGGMDQVGIRYTGTGIVPEMEKDNLSGTPTEYTWTFTEAVSVGPNVCSEDTSSHEHAAGAPCTQAFTPNPGYGRYQLGIEVATPPEGIYTVQVDGKTFTWTNVKVADFSAGKGFLALMSKYIVDDKGNQDPADDTVTGFGFKYVVKTDTGWELASADLIKLVVKGEGAYVSLKIGGDNNNQIGFTLPKEPQGTVEFSSVEANYSEQVSEGMRAAFRAGTTLFTDFSNPGVSYDDKLGMRYFF